jgi:hypothetical protein
MRKLLASLLLLCGTAIAATTTPVQLLNPAGSTAGQAIVSNGPSAVPTWGTVTAGTLAPIAANTVLGNFTGASAAPAASAVPSCSTANSALKYTTSTGLSCGTTFALTSGNLSQFAATTSAQLAGVLSDETGGSGVAVFNASPTFTGTVNVAALTATGIITPSQTAGIAGTTTNNDANAGSVGQEITANATGVSASNGVTANCTSAALAAGDYEVTGMFATFPAGGTTTSIIQAGISPTSGTVQTINAGPPSLANVALHTSAVPAGGQMNLTLPPTRIKLASAGNAYIVYSVNFAVSTMQVGCQIRARRVR